MTTPESEHHFVPISATPEKRRGEGFSEIPSRVTAGVIFVVEPGTELDITRKEEGGIYQLAKDFALKDEAIKGLEAERQTPRRQLIEIAQESNLRGIDSVPDNFRVRITPSVSVQIDPDLAKETLGAAFYAKVKEMLTLNIPLGAVTKEGVVLTRELILEILEAGLATKGLAETEWENLVKKTTSLTVNRETLEELERLLPPEAIKEEITWRVQAVPLRRIS